MVRQSSIPKLSTASIWTTEVEKKEEWNFDDGNKKRKLHPNDQITELYADF